MSDQALLSDVGLGMVLTYLLHSTGILAVCWIVVKLQRPESSWFQDKLWKSGALLGIATAFASTVATANSCSWGLPLVARGACHDLEASSGSKSISPVAPEASIEEELPIEVWEEPNADEQNAASEPTQPIPHAELPLEEYHGHAELPETPSKELFPARGWHVESAASGPWHWGLGLPMVASVCVLFGVWRLLWNYRACSRLLATCRTDNGGRARKLLDRYLKRQGIGRPVRLLRSDRMIQPMALGLARWTIVIPDRAEVELNPEELQALLAHEVGHLVRGDVWWSWIGSWLCTCLAFQPLNALAYRRWQRTSELLADDWAVRAGASPIALARCLTRVAEWCLASTKPTVATSLVADSQRSTLEVRVNRLLSESSRRPCPWRTRFRRSSFGVGLCIIGSLLVGVGPHCLPIHAAHLTPRPGLSDLRENWAQAKAELSALDGDLERLDKLLGAVVELPESQAVMVDIQKRFQEINVRQDQISQHLSKELR